MRPNETTTFENYEIEQQSNDMEQQQAAPKSNTGRKAAMLAAAGLVVGAGGATAATMLLNDGEEAAAPASPAAPAAQPAAPVHHHHAAPAHHAEHHATETPKVNLNGDSDIKIEGAEVITDENGEEHRIMYGTVDGKDAVFVDDGNGNVQYAVIDYNEDGEPQLDEVYNLSESGLTMSDIASLDPNVSSDVLVALNTTDGADDMTIDPMGEDLAMVDAVDAGVDEIQAFDVDDSTGEIAEVTENVEVEPIEIASVGGEMEAVEVVDVPDADMTLAVTEDVSMPDQASYEPEMPDYSTDSDILADSGENYV